MKIQFCNTIRHSILAFFVCVLLANAGCAAESAKTLSLPPDAKVTGSVDTSSGAIVATGTDKNLWRSGAAHVEGPIPAATQGVVLQGKIGKQDNGWLHFQLDLIDAQKKVTRMSFRVQSTVVAPDSIINIWGTGGKSKYYARPNPIYYSAEGWAKEKENWFKLPGASEYSFTVELRPVAGGKMEVWLEDLYMQTFAAPEPFVSYKISMIPGNVLESLKFVAAQPASSSVTVPIAAYPRVENMTDAKLNIDAKASLPADFQQLAGQPVKGIAVNGLGIIPGLARGRYWERNATENLPGQRMFTVPSATYSEAFVLCAVDDVADNSNTFTLRVTRFGRSGGDAIADSIVTVPKNDADANADARRVGTVEYGPANARKKSSLWLIKVPIKSGTIQDLLHFQPDKFMAGENYSNNAQSPNMATAQYLDVELLDPLPRVDKDDAFPPSMAPTGRSFAPPSEKPRSRNPKDNLIEMAQSVVHSGVHVFGLALEQSPATLEVHANTDFQVFYKSDNPAWLAKVQAREAGTYGVQWDFADIDGKAVASGKKSVTLAAGKEETITVPVDVQNGWYATRFQLLDAKGGVLLDHRGSYVCLPPDTRKAGFESPFGTWWFHWAHGGEPNIERVGPLLQRAGLRHTKLPESLPESITKKYGVTEWEVPWITSNKPTLAERLAEHEAHIAKFKELWPSVHKMLIWHESGTLGAAFPSEMWGEKPPAPSAKVDADWKERIEYVEALAKIVRAKYPDLKMKYGNHLDGLAIVAGLLRRKYPRQLIDTISIENLGQTFSPENPDIGGVQAAWYLRETARVLGYGDVPVTATHEWVNRRDTAVGLQTQAEWYVRDALHAMAYNFDTIALGSIHDAGNGYYFSAWGNGGLTGRYPLMQPKPSYAAFATLTRVLDGAKFQRAFPTGSHSLYALEFRRGNQWVYALWASRGQRAATVKFPAAGPRALIDIYGRESTPSAAQLDLKVSTATQYVVSDSQLTSVSPGASAFPDDAAPTSPLIVDAMDKAANWSIAPEPDVALEKTGAAAWPRYTKGQFELRQVVDAEKGNCLEVELKPQGELWAGTQEYAVLDLKTPVAVTGNHEFVGVWVKGNSSWGNVKFRVKRPGSSDAWIALSALADWPGSDAINFDGWNFLRMSLGSEEIGTNTQITGIAVTIPRQTLYLTEMTPTQNLTVRLKNLCVFDKGQDEKN